MQDIVEDVGTISQKEKGYVYTALHTKPWPCILSLIEIFRFQPPNALPTGRQA
jgi:hypothetical protein